VSPTDEPPGPQRSVVLAAFAAAVMIAQQVGGKATRDALFLDHYGAMELPKAMLGAAVLSILSVLATSSAMQRWGPGRVVPVAFTASGVLFVAEWFLLPVNPGLTSYAIYLHMGVFGAIVISGFWSVVNERFDPHSAKKAVARIAAAATFGGLVGGLGAERVAVLLEPRHMLAILGVLNAVCAVTVWRVGAPLRHDLSGARTTVEPGAGLRILREVPYLQKLGTLVLLIAMTTALLDFALKAQASDRLESDQTLMQFFALFYTATGLATFAVQSLFAKRALSRFGLDGTIALLPAMVLLTGVLATAVTRMWTVVAVKGVETVLQNSLFRSGYELLYTPLSPQRKRPTKTIVDVAFDRVGDALGSGVVFLVARVGRGDRHGYHRHGGGRGPGGLRGDPHPAPGVRRRARREPSERRRGARRRGRRRRDHPAHPEPDDHGARSGAPSRRGGRPPEAGGLRPEPPDTIPHLTAVRSAPAGRGARCHRRRREGPRVGRS